MPLVTCTPFNLPPPAPIIKTLGGSSSDFGYGIQADGTDFYITGSTQSIGQGSWDTVIAKYNSNGTLQWQRLIGGSDQDFAYELDVDSSGNIYVVGYMESDGEGQQDVMFLKYNSSGNILIQQALGYGPVGIETGYDIVVDGTSVYVSAELNNAAEGEGSYDQYLIKYNTSGVVQWERLLGGSSGDKGRGVGVDGSGNVYMAGESTNVGSPIGGLNATLAKYNSSGTLQWQRRLAGSGTDRFSALVVDSSGNCYAGGSTTSDGAGGTDMLLAKYNSSGVLQWQRVIGGTGSDVINKVALDGSGNVFACGFSTSEGVGSNNIPVLKFNSSGVLQWQNVLGATGSNQGKGVSVDSNGDVCIIGFSPVGPGASAMVIARFDGDGGGTGVFGSFTYESMTLTDSAATLTDQAGLLVGSTPTSMTSQATALTEVASTLTDTQISP